MRNCLFDRIRKQEKLKNLIADTTYYINYMEKVYNVNKKELTEDDIYINLLYINIIYKLEEVRDELHKIYDLVDNPEVERLLKNK